MLDGIGAGIWHTNLADYERDVAAQRARLDENAVARRGPKGGR